MQNHLDRYIDTESYLMALWRQYISILRPFTLKLITETLMQLKPRPRVQNNTKTWPFA